MIFQNKGGNGVNGMGGNFGIPPKRQPNGGGEPPEPPDDPRPRPKPPKPKPPVASLPITVVTSDPNAIFPIAVPIVPGVSEEKILMTPGSLVWSDRRSQVGDEGWLVATPDGSVLPARYVQNAASPTGWFVVGYFSWKEGVLTNPQRDIGYIVQPPTDLAPTGRRPGERFRIFYGNTQTYVSDLEGNKPGPSPTPDQPPPLVCDAATGYILDPTGTQCILAPTGGGGGGGDGGGGGSGTADKQGSDGLLLSGGLPTWAWYVGIGAVGLLGYYFFTQQKGKKSHKSAEE